MSKPLLQKLQTALDSGDLLSWIDNCYSNMQVLQKLGYSAKGNYASIVRNFLKDNDVDTTHFVAGGVPRKSPSRGVCPVCGKEFIHPLSLTRTKTTCSYSCSNTYFRTGKDNGKWQDEATLSNYRERALNHYKPICNRCSYSANVNALDVHHIDRNRDNNSLENLEVLCCNCHAVEHRSKNESMGYV